MKKALLKVYLLSLFGILFTPDLQANTCTLIYSLDMHAHKVFNQQISQLADHVKRKKLRFIDLTNWQSTTPHVAVSGRKRAQLRRQYALLQGINGAVLIDKNEQLIKRLDNTVDLVDVLLACRRH